MTKMILTDNLICLHFCFQMILSHIMRIRLGGKSYAPDPNSPLSQHVKGLGELTDLIHKIQTVVEEDPCPK